MTEPLNYLSGNVFDPIRTRQWGIIAYFGNVWRSSVLPRQRHNITRDFRRLMRVDFDDSVPVPINCAFERICPLAPSMFSLAG